MRAPFFSKPDGRATDVFWLFAVIVLQSASVAFAKQAALSVTGVALYSLLLSPYYLASLLMLAGQALCWALVIRRIDLSIAYPICSLSLVVNLLLATALFGESLHGRHLAAIGLILGGVWFLYRLPVRSPDE